MLVKSWKCSYEKTSRDTAALLTVMPRVGVFVK